MVADLQARHCRAIVYEREEKASKTLLHGHAADMGKAGEGCCPGEIHGWYGAIELLSPEQATLSCVPRAPQDALQQLTQNLNYICQAWAHRTMPRSGQQQTEGRGQDRQAYAAPVAGPHLPPSTMDMVGRCSDMPADEFLQTLQATYSDDAVQPGRSQSRQPGSSTEGW